MFKRLKYINWEAIIVLVLFLSISSLPGWLQLSILLINIFSFFISSIIIIRRANLKHFREQKNFVNDFKKRNGDIIPVMSVAIFGLFFAIYDLYIFYKSPLKKDFDNMQQQKRDDKLNKLGI
jgi:hypothetical protein